jgi:hypothetical protein
MDNCWGIRLINTSTHQGAEYYWPGHNWYFKTCEAAVSFVDEEIEKWYPVDNSLPPEEESKK